MFGQFLRWKVLQRMTVQQHLPFQRRLESSQRTQQGALTGAVGAKQTGETARFQLSSNMTGYRVHSVMHMVAR